MITDGQVVGLCFLMILFFVVIAIIFYVIIFYLVRFIVTAITGNRRTGNMAGVIAILVLLVITIAANAGRVQTMVHTNSIMI